MDEPRDELSCLIGVLAVTGPGRAAFRRAMAPRLAGGSPVREAIEQVARIGHLKSQADQARQIAATQSEPNQRAVSDLGLSVLRLGAPEYPALLAEIPDPPLALFVRGAGLPVGRAVAVVGSRRCRRNSAQLGFELAARLAKRGFAVVSGLAEGIDGAAHRGALDVDGITAAVLGNGLSHCYPAWHRGLGERIVSAGGALVSEYPPAWGPRAHHFPERNRIISGLAEAVLVIEASGRSGSLITARMALEQGRDVMAVPGPVEGPAHRGCHRLLKEGAALIEAPDDLWEVLGVGTDLVGAEPIVPARASEPLERSQARLLELIEADVNSTEALIEALGEPAARTLSLLTELELKGFVQALGDGYIRRPF